MPFDVAGFVEVEAPYKEELRILDEMARTPWCRGKYRDNGAYCIMGALVKADGREHILDTGLHDNNWSPAAGNVRAALMVETSSEAVNLLLFNDSIAKSFDDVLKVYARARKLFE